jgi:hypothetical protein
VSSLVAAGVLLLASVALQRWQPLRPYEEPELDPMRGPADLRRYPHVPPHAGPVVITVEYRVDPRDHDDFVVAMHEIGRIRRRDGARRWRLMQDLDDPEIWTERWQTASWLDHLRLLQRTTVADRAIRDRARAFHRGAAPPRVRHMLERTPDEARLRIEDEPPPVVRAAQTDPHNPGAEGPTAPRLRVN